MRRSSAERELENAQARLRALSAEEQQASNLRDRAQHRIARTEAELNGLSWRGRRRHGQERRRELAFQQRALAAAETKLAELEPERKRALARVQLAAKLAPTQERQSTREHRIERERQPSLDLGL